MNLSGEDQKLLEELCGQQGVSTDKVLKLLEDVVDNERFLEVAKVHPFGLLQKFTAEAFYRCYA